MWNEWLFGNWFVILEIKGEPVDANIGNWKWRRRIVKAKRQKANRGKNMQQIKYNVKTRKNFKSKTNEMSEYRYSK